MMERQGSILVSGAGVLFSLTAISVAAVEDRTHFQFLDAPVAARPLSPCCC